MLIFFSEQHLKNSNASLRFFFCTQDESELRELGYKHTFTVYVHKVCIRHFITDHVIQHVRHCITILKMKKNLFYFTNFNVKGILQCFAECVGIYKGEGWPGWQVILVLHQCLQIIDEICLFIALNSPIYLWSSLIKCGCLNRPSYTFLVFSFLL